MLIGKWQRSRSEDVSGVRRGPYGAQENARSVQISGHFCSFTTLPACSTRPRGGVIVLFTITFERNRIVTTSARDWQSRNRKRNGYAFQHRARLRLRFGYDMVTTVFLTVDPSQWVETLKRISERELTEHKYKFESLYSLLEQDEADALLKKFVTGRVGETFRHMK
jgi:hypothetical protein